MVQKGIIRAVTHLTNGMDMHVLVLLSFTCNGKPYSSAYVFISLSFYFYQNFTVLLGRVKHVLFPVCLTAVYLFFSNLPFCRLECGESAFIGQRIDKTVHKETYFKMRRVMKEMAAIKCSKYWQAICT
jgi:hypothetical protein